MLIQTGSGNQANATRRVKLAEGDIATRVSRKVDDVLNANAGLTELRYINAVLRNEEAAVVPAVQRVANLPPDTLSKYRYAPACTCDVERSFSRYKSVLRDNRQRFTFENLSRYFVAHCFAD